MAAFGGKNCIHPPISRKKRHNIKFTMVSSESFIRSFRPLGIHEKPINLNITPTDITGKNANK
jgi:hypothetical protein